MEPIEERRAEITGAADSVKIYVIAIVVTAALTFIAVVLVALLLPKDTAVVVIASIIGVSSPIIATFLGLGQHGMAVAQDGQRSLLIRAVVEKERAVAGKERAEGVLEGIDKGKG